MLPVFNESDGIYEFITELDKALVNFERQFLIVDDCSTDRTLEVVGQLCESGLPVEVRVNQTNLGHGQTVLRGFDFAISQRQIDLVVTCDGDGQISGSDLALLVHKSLEYDADIVEGARSHRSDPWFRRVASAFTRYLVFRSTQQWPKDANTPFRVVRREVLEVIRGRISDSCPIPNLVMTALSRRGGLVVHEVPIKCLPPRRDPSRVDHWNQRFKLLPSKRFMKFVLGAYFEWKQVRDDIENLEKFPKKS